MDAARTVQFIVQVVHVMGTTQTVQFIVQVAHVMGATQTVQFIVQVAISWVPLRLYSL